MSPDNWKNLQLQLMDQSAAIRAWERCDPNPSALRCEFSRHRTLAHLRACQEQWLIVLKAFLERDNPSVKIQHPWRHFEQQGFDQLSWEAHMSKFLSDRQMWLKHLAGADPERPGKRNGTHFTVGTLTTVLAQHEAHHIRVLRV